MTQISKSVILLRTIHGLFAVYFILCIVYIYYAAITLTSNKHLLGIAISSLLIEGFLVFVLNGGHCPLIYIQKKVNDQVPFFNLFLPDYLASKAIPFFTVLMFLGILLLIARYFSG